MTEDPLKHRKENDPQARQERMGDAIRRSALSKHRETPEARQERVESADKKPIEGTIRIAKKYFVYVGGDKATLLHDFGAGKRGLTLPPAVDENKLGFDSEADALAFASKLRLYIQDVKDKPRKKRAGSSKSWE